MRTLHTIVAASLIPAASLIAEERAPGCCGSGIPDNAVFRDAATHSTLTVRETPGKNPIRELRSATPPEDAMNSKAYVPQSIIGRSEVIHRGKVATLVPKRAVLHLPEGLRGSTGLPEGARLVSWAEFYRANRNWIRTFEVSRAQAEGETPLAEEAVESFKESPHLIVATYQTGPISVMPLREEESSNAAETKQQANR